MLDDEKRKVNIIKPRLLITLKWIEVSRLILFELLAIILIEAIVLHLVDLEFMDKNCA